MYSTENKYIHAHPKQHDLSTINEYCRAYQGWLGMAGGWIPHCASTARQVGLVISERQKDASCPNRLAFSEEIIISWVRLFRPAPARLFFPPRMNLVLNYTTPLYCNFRFPLRFPLYNRPAPSPSPQVYHRESAGTVIVILKVANSNNASCLLLGNPMNRLMRPPFSKPTTVLLHCISGRDGRPSIL